MRALSRRSGALAAAMILAGSGARAAATEVRLIRRPDKAYEISGSFDVEASTAVVWGVLTDYENIPAFVSSMRSSRVRETHDDGSLLVEQEAVGEAFLLSRTVNVLLEVRRSPGRVQFTDVGRADFRIYDGEWDVRRTAAGAAATYRLLVSPRFLAPAFLVSLAMKREARHLLDQVRAEIVRRALAK